jgi:hypothetical protein
MNRDVSTPLRGLRFGAVLIAAGIALAACGSSSSGGSGAAALNSPAAAATDTASAPAASSGGSGSGSFCGFAKTAQAQEANDSKAFTSDNPKQLATYSQKAVAELETFSAAAPSAIKTDVTTVVAGAEKLFTLLKKANYDYKKVDPTSFEAIDTPAFNQANAAIASYLKNTCGIDEGSG